MEDGIETERLRLRPIELGDLDDFVALHSDPEVTRFIRPLERRVPRPLRAERLGFTRIRDDQLGDPMVVYGIKRPT